MSERFTDRARTVMALANQEAQRFNHEFVGTEHILIGLIKEGSGIGATTLKNMGASFRKIRKEAEKLIKSGPDMVNGEERSKTPRAGQTIEFAIKEATSLKHNYVGTEHILLGILRVEGCMAIQILTNLGLKIEDVQQEALNLIGTDAKKENPVRFKIFRMSSLTVTEKEMAEFMEGKKLEGMAQSDTLATIAYRDSS